MRRVITVTEQLQHFVAELKDSLRQDLNGWRRLFWQDIFQRQSARDQDRHVRVQDYERRAGRGNHCDGICRGVRFESAKAAKSARATTNESCMALVLF